MAYQDRFKAWEATGLKVVPVLSRPDAIWKGERGYIQAAFSKAKQIIDPLSTGAVLCGHGQMTEDSFLYYIQCFSANHLADLEWKLIYVGSAEDETYDQLLESVLVGPVNVAKYRFVFEPDSNENGEQEPPASLPENHPTDDPPPEDSPPFPDNEG
ncbi:uncharacterized protein A4U43_C04F18940 [Asparagus officinalis]|uniref:Oxidoreductase FAD/NAD(P)-binding domain-containing protein n=1 Tax=Asparagus officinalis TaxID=4686 RepID=A0A5P1F6U6_ASPOF|nr:uncharacterized protein A4U43_C04F18940 [Asparagus officinalis]